MDNNNTPRPEETVLIGFDEMEKEKAKKAPENNNKPEKKKREKKKKRRGTVLGSIALALTYIIVVLGIAGTLGYYIIVIGNDIFGFVKSTELVEVTVPEHATLADIIEIYTENEIIKYPKFFELYAKYKCYADRPDND